jgi:hypothetical protein
VDYLFGAVAVDQPVIDWSGNCGNLSAAVGPYAVHAGLVDAPADGWVTVRIWQLNIARRILAHVPMVGGKVQETGDFELDGVTFPAAEVRLEFLDPGASNDENDIGALFPTGSMIDTLAVPGLGEIPATLINAGNPTIFIAPSHLGLSGTELPGKINAYPDLLARAEAIRAAGAVAMGLVATAAEATKNRPHTPKLALVAPPVAYRASDGKQVLASDVQLLVRIFSMGQLHHAMTGTGAVAIAAAAAIPGTLVHRVATAGQAGLICFGHPSGTLRVGAEARQTAGGWVVSKVMMSRSARILMEGWVRVPAD